MTVTTKYPVARQCQACGDSRFLGMLPLPENILGFETCGDHLARSEMVERGLEPDDRCAIVPGNCRDCGDYSLLG